MNVQIREATLADVEPFVVLGKIMHEETAFADITWDNERVMRFGKLAVTHDDFCVFVAEADGASVGMVIAQIVPFYFSAERRLCDHLWYVAEEYRGGPVAAQLIEKLIEFAKLNKVKEIYSGVSTGVNTDKTHDLLTKLNYQHLGGLYKYKVQG